MIPIAFMGSKAAGLALCQLLCSRLPTGSLKLILCPDDRQDARSVLPDFEALARQHDIPLRLVSSRTETLEALDEASPRFVLVHGWYQVIPVDQPGRDFLGFHYSPLPRYRGNAPLVWQILQGESELGISCFRFTAGMDEGELLAQRRFAFTADETIADALRKSNAMMLEIAEMILPMLLAGQLKLYPQPDEPPSYCGLRTPEDGRIDWHKSASVVHDFIRAQSQPYPGAYTVLPDGRRVQCWRASVEPRRFYGVPGAVVEVAADWVVIACGEGAIRLLLAGLEGGAPEVPGRELRSLRVRLG